VFADVCSGACLHIQKQRVVRIQSENPGDVTKFEFMNPAVETADPSDLLTDKDIAQADKKLDSHAQVPGWSHAKLSRKYIFKCLHQLAV